MVVELPKRNRKKKQPLSDALLDFSMWVLRAAYWDEDDCSLMKSNSKPGKLTLIQNQQNEICVSTVVYHGLCDGCWPIRIF